MAVKSKGMPVSITAAGRLANLIRGNDKAKVGPAPKPAPMSPDAQAIKDRQEYEKMPEGSGKRGGK